MNLMLFFWRIFSIGVTLSVTNGQGSTCPISKGTPSVVNKVLGSIDAEQKCAEACKTRTNCIWWQFKKRTNECSIAQLKINDDRKVNFAMKNCDSPPTTIPGLESLLAEVKNISRVVEDLKEKNENGLTSLNEKLSNVESQNQDLMVELENLEEQTNLTKTEINENIDAKFAVVYTDHEILKNEAQMNYNKSMEKLEENQKLSEVSIGMTLEEYEAKEMYCSTNGDFFDINTGFCYKYIVLNDTERTWDEARSQCSTLRGDLASIKSIQEWEVVKGHLRASGIYGESSAWIGLRDEGIEGTWMWTDGSPVTFSDWYPGRPYSRTSSTSWNCVAIGAYDGDMWRWAEILGDGCSEYRSAVCKKRA